MPDNTTIERELWRGWRRRPRPVPRLPCRSGLPQPTFCSTTSWSNSSPAPEHQDILGIKRGREQFEKLLLILELKLRLLTQRDHPLDYVVLALSTDLRQRCGTVNYVEKGVGHVHRDLRRAFKAMAMQYQKPTQILLDSTTGFDRQQA